MVFWRLAQVPFFILLKALEQKKVQKAEAEKVSQRLLVIRRPVMHCISLQKHTANVSRFPFGRLILGKERTMKKYKNRATAVFFKKGMYLPGWNHFQSLFAGAHAYRTPYFEIVRCFGWIIEQRQKKQKKRALRQCQILLLRVYFTLLYSAKVWNEEIKSIRILSPRSWFNNGV